MLCLSHSESCWYSLENFKSVFQDLINRIITTAVDWTPDVTARLGKIEVSLSTSKGITFRRMVNMSFKQ